MLTFLTGDREAVIIVDQCFVNAPCAAGCHLLRVKMRGRLFH